MIVSHLLGGIGNQMFQYASGRSLAAHLNQTFFLDVSSFDFYPLHQGFELESVFNIVAKQSTSLSIRQLLGWRSSSLAIKVLRRSQFSFLRGSHLVVEPHMNFWSPFFNAHPNTYLYGYWQSEKYFKSVESIIRKDFSFKKPLNAKSEALAQKITSVNAVSLHVRRGDYVTDSKTVKIMSLCQPAYYQRGISYIAERVTSPVFFVFSDDIEWTRQHIEIDYPCIYIDHNCNQDSYMDMQLMSLCKHHIIANSTFSWWGAWLNPSIEKIVVAPSIWFKDGSVDADLIPVNWVRL
jgi:hypothetical protein